MGHFCLSHCLEILLSFSLLYVSDGLYEWLRLSDPLCDTEEERGTTDQRGVTEGDRLGSTLCQLSLQMFYVDVSSRSPISLGYR